MGHLWLTDCNSLYEHLASPKSNTVQNKRLGIDLQLLRQMIWERDGDHIGEIDHAQGDYPRWIDTSVMLADPLTKVMKPDVMTKVLGTGTFNMCATPESLAIKEKNRQARQRMRSEKNSQ